MVQQVQGKAQKRAKKPALGVMVVYIFENKQISINEFGQPVGMKLSSENRWVKKSHMIPWAEIEKRYAPLFSNRKGNVANPLRLALGACINQAEYGYSDVETALQIQKPLISNISADTKNMMTASYRSTHR